MNSEVSASLPAAALWVFGYGSLMWNPGFVYSARRKARLVGWSRRLCIWSHHYRGTPERPGLVFGLDRGGECHGVAFCVEPAARTETLAYLRKRELISNVYDELEAPAVLESGESVEVLAYVANAEHPQYAGRLEPMMTLEIVKGAAGLAGRNDDYVRNTHSELIRLDIPDAELDWLTERL
jgi:cation transport protein ChaC